MKDRKDGRAATILVVDDEPDVVTYLTILLEDAGYRTLSAENGIEAWRKMKEEHVDLVSLDITMPEQSGIRFYRDLKEDSELQSTPVIIVTAVTGYGGDPDVFERFLSTRRQIPPPEGFVSKPIDCDRFLELVDTVLAGDKQGVSG